MKDDCAGIGFGSGQRQRPWLRLLFIGCCSVTIITWVLSLFVEVTVGVNVAHSANAIESSPGETIYNADVSWATLCDGYVNFDWSSGDGGENLTDRSGWDWDFSVAKNSIDLDLYGLDHYFSLPNWAFEKGSLHMHMPLWVPLLTFLAPVFVSVWRSRRRISSKYCARCGYNLTGNQSGSCPECGLTIPVDAPLTDARNRAR